MTPIAGNNRSRARVDENIALRVNPSGAKQFSPINAAAVRRISTSISSCRMRLIAFVSCADSVLGMPDRSPGRLGLGEPNHGARGR